MKKSKWTNIDAAKELINRISKQKLNSGQKCQIIYSHNKYKSGFNSVNLDLHKLLLKNLIKFDSDIPEALKTDIVTQAIFESADHNKLQLGYLEGCIKKLEKEYLQITKQIFVLVTRVSIVGIKKKNIVRTNNSLITISKYFPQKYKLAYDFDKVSSIYPMINQKSYSWITVEVNARCINSAADKALDELNYWIGIMNVYYNYNKTRTSFGKPAPINKIRKYPYHSLHLPNGEKATQLYWYEPNYSYKGDCLKVDDSYLKAKIFYKKLSFSISKTSRVDFFINVFNRYSEALDTDDMNKSFLSLWSLLEHLTLTEKENYNITIARTLVLFKDKFLILNKLELLRNKRNMAIHSGKQYDEAEMYAYMLIGIINEYLFFIVDVLNKTNSTKQLTRVLDLPTNKEKLEERQCNIYDEIENINILKSLIGIE